MSTQAQILANRENAQKSTGPRTVAGKTTASQNAVKHGLSARCDVISTEDQAEFDAYRDEMLAELAPVGPTESMLADRIVSLSWRLKRTGRIQNQVIDALHADHGTPSPLAKLAQSLIPKTLLPPEPDPTDHQPDLSLGRLAIRDFSNARVLDRLLMYERRIEHSLFKTMLELQRLRLIRTLPSPETASGTLSDTHQPNPPRPDHPAQSPERQRRGILCNCRESSTNHPFLRKTNPISKTRDFPQLLVKSRLTENPRQMAPCKTNPNEPNCPGSNAFPANAGRI